MVVKLLRESEDLTVAYKKLSKDFIFESLCEFFDSSGLYAALHNPNTASDTIYDDLFDEFPYTDSLQDDIDEAADYVYDLATSDVYLYLKEYVESKNLQSFISEFYKSYVSKDNTPADNDKYYDMQDKFYDMLDDFYESGIFKEKLDEIDGCYRDHMSDIESELRSGTKYDPEDEYRYYR